MCDNRTHTLAQRMLLLLCAGWLVSVASSAWAQDRDDGLTERTRVIMMVRANQGFTEALADFIEAQLAGLDVQFVREDVPELGPKLPDQIAAAANRASRPDVLAVVWFDQTKQQELYLFLRGPGDGPTLVRNVGKPRAERKEAVAIIIRSSVSALQKGLDISFEEISDPLPKNADEVDDTENDGKGDDNANSGDEVEGPPITSPEPSHAWLRLETAYNLTGATGTLDHGILLALAVPFHENWTAWAGFAFVFPHEAAAGDTTFTMQRHPITAGLRLVWPFSWGQLAVLVGATGDIVTRETNGPIAQLVPQDGTEFLFSGLGGADFRVSLSSRVDLFVTAAAEVFANPPRYVVLEGDAVRPIVGVNRVGVWANSGVAIDLF